MSSIPPITTSSSASTLGAWGSDNGNRTFRLPKVQVQFISLSFGEFMNGAFYVIAWVFTHEHM